MVRHPRLRTPDHPRIRGEHARPSESSPRTPGSSPHTRGARGANVQVPRPPRIIPAYAGSTLGSQSPRSPTTDHPRIRGEHRRGRCVRRRLRGSSPHTRGAPPSSSTSRARPRIIPAYAGSTQVQMNRAIADGDHPRIRGEHPYGLLLCEGCEGSSPHTRGAHRSMDGQARGRGSSPHTRGALRQQRLPGFGGRIIPAYAGSTTSPPKATTRASDHPRIRGEHPGGFPYAF